MYFLVQVVGKGKYTIISVKRKRKMYHIHVLFLKNVNTFLLWSLLYRQSCSILTAFCVRKRHTVNNMVFYTTCAQHPFWKVISEMCHNFDLLPFTIINHIITLDWLINCFRQILVCLKAYRSQKHLYFFLSL